MDRPLRILVVTNMYPSAERPWRGTFVRSQVEALRRSGRVDVAVASFEATGRPWRYVLEPVRLALRRTQADIVHAHYGLSGPAALAAAGTRPIVLTVHGRDCHHPVVRRITAAVAHRAAAVIAVSRELAAICPVPTTDVIPVGVDVQRFRPMDRRTAREALGLPLNRRLLLFAADPTRPEKRYDRAAALAEALPEASLVTMRGRPHNEVPLWHNAADALIVTSDREGYGLACMEALACNVPVLSTPVGIAPEVLAAVPGALCAPFQVSTWAAHVRRLFDHADPRVPGRAVACAQSTDAMARRLVTLYEMVLTSRRGQTSD